MGLKELYAAADNRGVLNKAYKLLITRKERICNRCPYHRGENAFRKRKDRKNWKTLSPDKVERQRHAKA
jgi:hypothetical protein